jgi:hypothetical protein
MVPRLKKYINEIFLDVSFKSTQRNPEVFGFFYDELASMLNNANLCPKFEVNQLGLTF